MTNSFVAWSGVGDVELVNRSRAGDREAFGEVVSRYQRLVASLAYSTTGSLAQSEDLAQETFLAAWRHISDLRDPAKLRSWLCGIARNLSMNAVRRETREPVDRLASLESTESAAGPELAPSQQAISREEEELLWRAVARIPEAYREPLVLFYREHQSIRAVADALELSEEAAKQRLSRGRKLLQDEVATFVESTLARSGPGRAFTLGVLAALPAFGTSAHAATIAAATAKGSATASSAGIVGLVNLLLGPIIGVAGAFIGVKSSLAATRTPRERAFVMRQTKRAMFAAILFNVALVGFIFGLPQLRGHPLLLVVLGAGIPIGFAIFICVTALRANREQRAIRSEEVRRNPGAFTPAERLGAVKEYRWGRFLGLPLFHYRSGALIGEGPKPAKGWIAIGDRAQGILFAGGGVAFGGIAMGGVAVGGVAFGGASLGVLSLGGLALGVIAMGGGAVGVLAAGGVAVGVYGAVGGLAIAKQFAIGGGAFALHANDAAARQFVERFRWLDLSRPEMRRFFAALRWLPCLVLLLPLQQAWRRRKSLRARAEQ